MAKNVTDNILGEMTIRPGEFGLALMENDNCYRFYLNGLAKGNPIPKEDIRSAQTLIDMATDILKDAVLNRRGLYYMPRSIGQVLQETGRR